MNELSLPSLLAHFKIPLRPILVMSTAQFLLKRSNTFIYQLDANSLTVRTKISTARLLLQQFLVTSSDFDLPFSRCINELEFSQRNPKELQKASLKPRPFFSLLRLYTFSAAKIPCNPLFLPFISSMLMLEILPSKMLSTDDN